MPAGVTPKTKTARSKCANRVFIHRIRPAAFIIIVCVARVPTCVGRAPPRRLVRANIARCTEREKGPCEIKKLQSSRYRSEIMKAERENSVWIERRGRPPRDTSESLQAHSTSRKMHLPFRPLDAGFYCASHLFSRSLFIFRLFSLSLSLFHSADL